MALPDDIQVYLSPHVPRGLVYLMSGLSPVYDDQLLNMRWRIDPWGPNRYAEPEIESERRKGLDFIAGLLDGLCETYGWNPDTVWRGPKEREGRAGLLRRYIAEDHVYMAMPHNPRDFVAVTVDG